MKEKFANFVKSRTFYIIIAVLLAIMVWLIVVQSKNPTTTRSIEVPITFENRNVLSENHLEDTSVTSQPTKVTVKVSGSAVFVNKLLPSDITVVVDYAEVKGPGDMKIKIHEPVCEALGVNIDSYYPTEIECTYDKKIEKYIPVEVEYDDTLSANGISIVKTEVEPANILLTDYSIVLDQVSKVKVNLADALEKGSVKDNGSASLVCHFYNEAGDDISYNFDTEKVTVKYFVGKIVPVTYTLSGNPDKGYYVISDTCDTSSVKLYGNKGALSGISKINLGTIDVSGSKSFSKSIDMRNLISNDIEIVGNSSAKVTVEIGTYSSKTVSLTADAIKKTGEKNSYSYSYAVDSSTVELIGSEAGIKAVKDSSVSFSIDVSKLHVGTTKVDIKASLPDGIKVRGTYTCSVTVKEKASDKTAPVESGTPTPNAEPTAASANNP